MQQNQQNNPGSHTQTESRDPQNLAGEDSKIDQVIDQVSSSEKQTAHIEALAPKSIQLWTLHALICSF